MAVQKRCAMTKSPASIQSAKLHLGLYLEPLPGAFAMKINNRQYFILNCLRYKGRMTAKELALQVNVSERTVKKEIALLKEALEGSFMSVTARQGEGYSLAISDEQAAGKFFGDARQYYQMAELVKNDYERSSYIVKRMLLADGYIKTEDLADEMYVSRSTVNAGLREVKSLLSKFHLDLRTRPNYGMEIVGREFDKRLCISDYFFHNTISAVYSELDQKSSLFQYSQQQVEEIEALLRESCERSKLYLSDFSYKNIAIHVLIVFTRNDQNSYLQDAEMAVCEGAIGQSARRAAQDLADALAERFRRVLLPQEILYIALHIDSKQIIRHAQSRNVKVDAVLQQIYTEIRNNFNIDLSPHHQLYEYLSLHIPQMILRIRRRISIRNPMVYENLRNYLFALKVTVSAVAIIEREYDVQVGLDEFGYLLIYFHLALTSFRQTREVSIGFVSGRGRSESLMYRSELIRCFSQDKIKLHFYDSLQDIKSRDHPVDILVSLYPIEHTIYNVAIEEGRYIEKIRNRVDRLQQREVDLSHYFRPEYFVANLKGSTKTEVMAEIVQHFRGIGAIYDEELAAPPFVSHQIGNGAIHLQDLQKHVHGSICFVGVLEKPIIWNQYVARFVFLIKTKRDGDADLYQLCDVFSRFVSDTDRVNTLLKNRSFDSFLASIRSL